MACLHTMVYPEVPDLTTGSKDIKWHSFLQLGATLSLLSKSVFTLDILLCLYVLQGSYHSPSTYLFIMYYPLIIHNE